MVINTVILVMSCGAAVRWTIILNVCGIFSALFLPLKLTVSVSWTNITGSIRQTLTIRSAARLKNKVKMHIFLIKKVTISKKTMCDCTGQEICAEWLYHMGVPVSDIDNLSRHSAKTAPCMMPYITAFFMPREKRRSSKCRARWRC